MGFEKVTPNGGPNPFARKFISIYATGKGRFSKPAAEEWLDGVERVELYADTEENQIGIALGGDDDAYSLNGRGDDGGPSVHARSLLRQFGIDREKIESAVRLDLEHHPDEGLLVADATPLLEEVSDGGC
jgi:hypothetical protein